MLNLVCFNHDWELRIPLYAISCQNVLVEVMALGSGLVVLVGRK